MPGHVARVSLTPYGLRAESLRKTQRFVVASPCVCTPGHDSDLDRLWSPREGDDRLGTRPIRVPKSRQFDRKQRAERSAAGHASTRLGSTMRKRPLPSLERALPLDQEVGVRIPVPQLKRKPASAGLSCLSKRRLDEADGPLPALAVTMPQGSKGPAFAPGLSNDLPVCRAVFPSKYFGLTEGQSTKSDAAPSQPLGLLPPR
jgi:hypothetical protein